MSQLRLAEGFSLILCKDEYAVTAHFNMLKENLNES